jgi:hypothetical protein
MVLHGLRTHVATVRRVDTTIVTTMMVMAMTMTMMRAVVR